MNSKFKVFSILITLLLSYFYASAPGQKLLFLDGIIPDSIHAFVFDRAIYIMTVFLFLYIVNEIYILFRNKNKTFEKQCHNACQYIYSYVEETMGEEIANNIRVTIFKAFHSPVSEYVVLKSVERYQKKEPQRNAKVKFLPNIGVAGVCFATNSLILENRMPEFDKKPDAYFKYCQKNYNLDKDLIEKLNCKSCFYLGIPISCYNTGQTWGVLMIDSTKKSELLCSGFERYVEGIIKHYKVFFIEGEK